MSKSAAITLESLAALPSEKERVELLLSDLNPGQHEAAMQINGPVAVIAGAGAGKTKTLIARTAHMLIKGIPATSLMLMTFTNKGADEIKSRLEAMVGSDAQYITAGTFHSIIYQSILKAYADHPFLANIGLNMQECAILDDKDAKELLNAAIASLGPDELEMIKEKEWARDIDAEMADARAKGYGPEEYARNNIGMGHANDILYRLTHDVWQRYSLLCREANGIDFDDILVIACRFLDAAPDVSHELAERFRYIMLDEYQDTNPVQMRIMDNIARHHENIFVVGDDKQSIYKFRGADVKVILGFHRRYPKAKIVDIGINYRSAGPILDAANGLAGNMTQKASEGTLIRGATHIAKERPVAMVSFENDHQEAKIIVASIRRELMAGVKGSDMAILYRSRAQKPIIERELVNSGIGYHVVGDTGFFQRREVRNTLAFLRMMFRPWDSMAVLRVLSNTSFGVSDNSAKKAMSKGVTAHAFLREMAEKTRAGSEPTAVALKIKPLLGAMQSIRRLVAYKEDHEYIRQSVSRLWDTYMKPSVLRDAKKDEAGVEEAMQSRLQNVNFLMDRFFTDLKEGRRPEDILDELTMMVESNGDHREKENQVNMMTIHASKGMEFRHVYLPGMDLDNTPGENCDDIDDREEERRIIYVGITRAMEKLVMTYAKSKVKHGRKMMNTPSPFLKEVSAAIRQPIYPYRPRDNVKKFDTGSSNSY